MLKAVVVYIPCLFFLSCNRLAKEAEISKKHLLDSLTTINTTTLKGDSMIDSTDTKKIISSKRDTTIISMDTITFDRQEVFAKYFKELIDSLNNNSVPIFIYNECLDAKEVAYCDLGSDRSASLRFDLLKRLSAYQLQNLLKIADVNKLKRKCIVGFLKEKTYGNLSTFEIINLIKSGY